MTIQTFVRRVAFGVAALFFVATLFQLADRLNLVATPPDLPAANLVQRIEAAGPYRQAIWPIFFATNFLFGVGFVALAGLGVALAARRPTGDTGRLLLVWLLGIGGILGAVASLIRVGAVQASIDIPYCDCGFKDQEIVSQVWAEMVVDGAVLWLINGASLLAAFGAVAAGRLIAGVRTKLAIVSGSTRMPFHRYVLADGIGAAVWASGVGLLGYLFASSVAELTTHFSDASRWIGLAAIAIVVVVASWLGVRYVLDHRPVTDG